MAEIPADPAAAAENGVDSDAENQAVPRIAIEHQYIKDLSFENPAGPTSAEIVQENPEVTVEVSTSARTISEDRYEVCLIVRGQATLGDSPVFIVELTYGAVIALYDVPEDTVQPILLIEGARQIFPFARNIVADISRDGGFPPLFLQPIDFMQLYQDQHSTEDAD